METPLQAAAAALRLIVTGDAEVYRAVSTSLLISLTATVIAFVVGSPLGALLAVRSFPGRRPLLVITNAMMGLPPGTPYELAVPARTGTVPLVNLDTESMEKQALMFRAELRAIDYQKRISAKEARAVFLELFPSLKLSFGGYYNSNSFFLYQNWLGYASQASWNLLSVFRTPAKLKAVEAHREVLESQSLALTMAILTEVHVGAVQFVHAKQEFQNARQYHETQSAIAEHTRSLWLTHSTNDLTLIKERVNDVLAEVRLDSAQSGVETAYATLMASLGEDAVPAGLGGQSVAELADALKQLWEPAGPRIASVERRSEIHATSAAR